jgi:hypothetical protein
MSGPQGNATQTGHSFTNEASAMGEQHQCKNTTNDTNKTQVSAWARGLPSRFRMERQRASLAFEHTVATVTRQQM